MTAPIRVLLLEDDPADARLVGRMLHRIKTIPFEVEVVGRLAQAVDRLTRDAAAFDVVLADLGLPDSNGIATLDALTGAAPRLPVVVLTGNDDDAVALEAVKRGAQDYLVKGIGDAFILSRVMRYAIERKLGEEALREARDTAEQAARAKSLFLAMMGHEIRTPLNGVLGMARLLLETPLDPRQQVYAETLVSSGELLLGLVNDVLDFSRLDAGGLTLEAEAFDLFDTVGEVRLILAPRAEEKGLNLTLRCAAATPRHVVGDRLRLRQILFNLVGNAIKFTDGGDVVIAVEPWESGLTRIAVIDTGIGIPEAARPHLFTEFWQGDSGTARRFAGAGLGLAICARLVALMGGRIDCTSESGRGTTFTVDLPLPRSEVVRRGGEAAPAASGGRPRRILLVDDNQVNREVAAGLLERRGHDVVAVCDGFQAIEAAGRGGFDLVLLDMRMPGMDGIETARAITALPGEAGRVPLVLLTANPVAGDEDRWRDVGIRGCLAKPFRIDDLTRLLAGLFDPAAAPEPPEPPTLLSRPDLLADRRDLGHERMVALAELFRRSSAEDLAQARDHAAAGRLDDLARMAHRMAGGASSLHLVALTAACRAVEAAALRRETAAIAPGLADLDRLWRASTAALAEALA